MLGGKNIYKYNGNYDSLYYYIGQNNIIYYCHNCDGPNVFTLEKFIKKFPYKVGDRVRVPEYESEVCISKMRWDGNEVQYEVVTDEIEWYSTKELNEFNEPNREAPRYLNEKANKQAKEIEKLLEPAKEIIENLIKIDIPKGYEFTGVDNQQVVFAKIGCKYPKTYEECCEVLSISSYYKLKYSTYEHGYHEYTTSKKLGLLQYKLNTLGKLLICRNAYWKIAGEQMGLEKPWEHDRCFVIANNNGNIYTYEYHGSDNIILAFPTAEIRDAFYENFKDLIIECYGIVII